MTDEINIDWIRHIDWAKFEIKVLAIIVKATPEKLKSYGLKPAAACQICRYRVGLAKTL